MLSFPILLQQLKLLREKKMQFVSSRQSRVRERPLNRYTTFSIIYDNNYISDTITY